MQEALIIETITEELDTIADLEAKIEAYERVAGLEANLKPKTCDGCEYEDDKRGGHCYAFHTHCSREPAADHYTPRKGE